MLPSVVIYLSGPVGVWAGEVLDGAVGTADGGAMGTRASKTHFIFISGAVALGSCGTWKNAVLLSHNL